MENAKIAINEQLLTKKLLAESINDDALSQFPKSLIEFPQLN
jgi:hypothetical protein